MIRKFLIGCLSVLALLGIFACAQILQNSGQQTLGVADNDTLRVATLNVHYINTRKETGAWSLADWDRRKTPLDLAVKAMDADIVAFQEMESFAGGSVSQSNLTLDWLLAQNASYAAAAVGNPVDFPSTQPIFYRTARLQLVDQGWFFFSETPDVIYARTFNGSFPAFASWAAFEDRKSGKRLRIVNLHTDFMSLSNRTQSMDLVAERIEPWIEDSETILVAGDFNARIGSETLGILEAKGVTFPPMEGATYHFNRGLNLFGAIDHIGYTGDIELAASPVVLRQKFAGEWPTDHYPVIVDFRK